MPSYTERATQHLAASFVATNAFVYLAAGLACILRQHDDSVMKGFEIVKLARSLVIGRRTTAADSLCKVLPTESWLWYIMGNTLVYICLH